MSRTRHSARVFIVLDEAQDYEESDRILGVYGSLKAAQRATPRLRSRHLTAYERWRYTTVQLWAGDELLDEWTFHPGVAPPRTGWQHTPPTTGRITP